MSAPRSSHPHRLTTIGIASLFVMFAALCVASPAAAHDALQPEQSSPVPGSTIETMPEQITLAFSDALLTLGPQDTVIDVLAPSGAEVSEGDAVVDGALVTQEIGTVTETGAYTVNWHVVSSDGHPTEGSYEFTVTTVAPASPAATATPDPAATEQPTATQQPEEPTATATAAPLTDEADDDSGTAAAWPWILLVTAIIVVAAALLPLVIRRMRDDRGHGPAGQS
ncbi:copper resistance CopC family protein [Microbacterium phosphatis]|uniref:copper resistance CopC family protein n=1 Tax=Microbacterium phosphatis TaxID=3140248 RepID=UPI0031401F76